MAEMARLAEGLPAEDGVRPPSPELSALASEALKTGDRSEWPVDWLDVTMLRIARDC